MKYIKRILFIAMLMPSLSYAKQSIQPIIHGQTYASFQVPIQAFGKPSKINKDGVDSCNDSFFPDQYVYKDFTILDRGLVYEVILNENNGLIFYNKKIDSKMNKSIFLQQFKNIVDVSPDNPNIYYAESKEDATTIISFFFKGEKLMKYKIVMNDC